MWYQRWLDNDCWLSMTFSCHFSQGWGPRRSAARRLSVCWLLAYKSAQVNTDTAKVARTGSSNESLPHNISGFNTAVRNNSRDISSATWRATAKTQRFLQRRVIKAHLWLKRCFAWLHPAVTSVVCGTYSLCGAHLKVIKSAAALQAWKWTLTLIKMEPLMKRCGWR